MEASITINASVGECDETLETIRQWLQDNARVSIPDANVSGIIVQADTPGADDRDKIWFRTSDCGLRQFYWSTSCSTWCAVEGAPGDQITRHRINDTVAEDIEQYFGCGWELADGTNALEIDLRTFEAGVSGEYELTISPIYSMSSLTLIDIETEVETIYSDLLSSTYTSLAAFISALNTEFTSQSAPVTASSIDGIFLLTTDEGSNKLVKSATDLEGEPLIKSA